MKAPGKNIALFALFFLATLVVRFFALIFIWPNYISTATFPDEHNYYLSAASLINQSLSGFIRSDRLLWNGPLNPIWVAVLGGNVALIKSLNVVIFSAASALLGCAVASGFGKRAAFIVTLGLLLYPPTYELVPTLLTEPLFTSLLMLSLASLIGTGFSLKGAAWSGVLLGVATLVRPTTQFFPFLLLVLGLVCIRRLLAKRFILHAVCAIAVILPVLSWNWYHFHKVGIANGSGALCLGSDLRVDGDEPLYYGVDFDTFETTAPYTHLDSEGDRRLMELTKSRISRFPRQFATMSFRKFWRFLFGSYYGYFWPYNGLVGKLSSDAPLTSKVSGLIWPAVHVFAVVIGFVAVFSKRVPIYIRAYIALMTAYFALLHALAFPIPRMVLPLFPYILTLAAIAWVGMRSVSRVANSALAISALALVSAPRAEPFPTESDREYVSVFTVRRDGRQIGANDIRDREGRSIVGGSDPFYIFDFEPFELRRNQVVSFKFKAACPDLATRSGVGQVFWGVDGAPFTEQSSIAFPLRSIEALHVVRPALSSAWKGGLTRLRIDLPANFTGCGIEVSEVSVLN